MNTPPDAPGTLPRFGDDPKDYARLSLSRDIRAILYREGLVESPEVPTYRLSSRPAPVAEAGDDAGEEGRAA